MSTFAEHGVFGFGFRGAAAAGRRHNVLEKMRKNEAIDEQQFRDADVSELGVTVMPADHQPCRADAR